MKTLLYLFFLISNFLSTGAFANVVHAPHVDAELISENKSIQPGQKFWVAVRLQLEKQWHVYWENPGDSGLPTQIQWNLPSDFSASGILWPIPSRIEAAPLVNYGFEGDELFLTEISVPASIAANKNISIEANVSWLVCREECIPGKAKLALELPVSEEVPAPNSWKIAFESARGHTPQKLEASAELADDKILLHVPQQLPNKHLEFFPLDEPVVAGLAEQTVKNETSGITLQLIKANGFDFKFKNLRGLLVVKDKNSSATFSVFLPLKNTPPKDTDSLFLELLFAFLGGLILNFMPCVFPVLSMKILAVTNGRASSAANIRRHGIFYALGVMCSFWMLALSIYFAKTTGQDLGWGFQLQSPTFVACLTLLFFLVSLNFLGAFEVGNGLMGVGSTLASREGVIGDFFTGVLAVVVASPCSAPFMGTAIGYAISAPLLENFLIFTFLAMGLAAPYLLLSFSPKVLQLLPRPGVWMIRLKEFFAFPMLLTVIWLLWVFTQQCGMASGFFLILALFFLALLAWVKRSLATSVAKGCIIVFCLSAALLSVFYFGPQFGAGSQAATSSEWKPYSAMAVADALKSGDPVFIDFTAAWCLTCQVNERLVLQRQEARDLFQGSKVQLFRGDWTNKDPAITMALEQVGRAGVPVYLAYARGKKEVQILPQLLTVDALKAAFKP